MNPAWLYEKHSMQNGDIVRVTVRDKPNETYLGTIYNIINLPFNRALPNGPFVDHFYIQFIPEIYSKLLKRGNEIIYNSKPSVTGTIQRDSSGAITKFTLQSIGPCSSESESSPNNINAMLIWRIAYNIQPV
jgi:hypothetical protein